MAEDSEERTTVIEWWPLERVLTEFRPGSYPEPWDWQMEHDDLWFGISARRMDALATSMQEEGQRDPILLGTDGRVWDGHHRVCVAMRLGIEKVLVEASLTGNSGGEG